MGQREMGPAFARWTSDAALPPRRTRVKEGMPEPSLTPKPARGIVTRMGRNRVAGSVRKADRARCRAAARASMISELIWLGPNMIARQVPRDVHEDARDLARRLMGTKHFLKSHDERKRVEMRFAHLKTHHGFERVRLRRLSGARDEFHLAAIVQNLKTLALRVLRPPHLPGVA